MSDFLRPPGTSPDKLYEVAWQSHKRRQLVALLFAIASKLEDWGTTLLVVATLFVMIHPGANKTLTEKYLAIDWLHYSDAQDTQADSSKSVDAEMQTSSSAAATRMIEAAKQWINKDFKPGVTAQCAVFIQHVAKEADVDLRCTAQPKDGQFPVGPAYANCFFGDDVGTIITDRAELQQGDLVAFGGTYGGHPKSVITHVGIYDVDDMIIDRSTMTAPVRYRSMDVFESKSSGFLYAVRPHAYSEQSAAAASLAYPYSAPTFLQSDKLDKLRDQLVETARAAGLNTANLSLAIADLESGQATLFNAEQARYPASTIKLLWAISALDYGHAGDDVRAAIVESDNEASNRLLNAVGADQMQTYWASLTSRRIADEVGHGTAQNQLSAAELLRLLHDLNAASDDSLASVKQLMRRDVEAERGELYGAIQGYLANHFPIGTEFYNKPGWTSDSRSEAALVKLGGRMYAIAIIAEGKEYADSGIFADLGTVIYQELN